jgi:hypothetical protein
MSGPIVQAVVRCTLADVHAEECGIKLRWSVGEHWIYSAARTLGTTVSVGHVGAMLNDQDVPLNQPARVMRQQRAHA